jgi:hypothetical protein
VCAEEISESAGYRIDGVARNDIGVQVAGIAVPEMLVKIIGHRRADENAGTRTFERVRGDASVFERFPGDLQ